MRVRALDVLRGLWLSLPVTVGPAIEGALDGVSVAMGWTAAVGLWLAWAGVLLALLVPRIPSLTALRFGVAGLVAVAVATALEEVEARTLAAVGVAALVAVVAAWPTVGEALVDGSSYGPERRFPLRTPPVLGIVLAPLAVALALAGVATGPLLLAAEQWAAGVALTVVGAGVFVVAVRSVHSLAHRFLVLVPGGVVVHDPLALSDPVLFNKAALTSFGPAPVGTDARDLTLGAGGLVLELRLGDPMDLVLRSGDSVRTAAVLVCPVRPAAVLAEARSRGVPLG